MYFVIDLTQRKPHQVRGLRTHLLDDWMNTFSASTRRHQHCGLMSAACSQPKGKTPKSPSGIRSQRPETFTSLRLRVFKLSGT